MFVSSRVKDINESITLKLNAMASEMADSGRSIFNLTAGQLPFRPPNEFTDFIKAEVNFLKSFQYTPVPGFKELRKKFMSYVEKSRHIDFSKSGVDFDCIISNGGKHSLANVIWSLIDPGDEVIILAPYWVSYPQLVQFCRGIPVIIQSSIFDAFTPNIEDIRRAICPKTKAIIINSPNNPSGIHYSKQWMKEFGELMLDYPDITIINDEIYYELSYFDPGPTYFYQQYPQLLKQTVIVDGISKSLASTGLRIGFCVAPQNMVQAMSKLQGQTTSGANALIQRALINCDFDMFSHYLTPIKNHLRSNAQTVQELLRKADLANCWYQTTSAFYYMMDFSSAPVIEHYRKDKDDHNDYAHQIAEDLLASEGVAIVPGTDFGIPNSARMSLVLESGPFTEAMGKLIHFMKRGPKLSS